MSLTIFFFVRNDEWGCGKAFRHSIHARACERLILSHNSAFIEDRLLRVHRGGGAIHIMRQLLVKQTAIIYTLIYVNCGANNSRVKEQGCVLAFREMVDIALTVKNFLSTRGGVLITITDVTSFLSNFSLFHDRSFSYFSHRKMSVCPEYLL
jgi:hypothetical protein